MDLDEETRQVVEEFAQAVRRDHDVLDVVVFGSRARGDHRLDSDLDVAVVPQGEIGDQTAVALVMADVAYEILLDRGLHIHPFPVWEGELENVDGYVNPDLLRNIRREGVSL